MSSLPPGWVEATVGEVGSVQLGRQRAPAHHRGADMRPYLRVANVFENRIDTTDVLCMNFTPDEFERFRLSPGDILLNEGQSKELVGRPAMFRGELADVCFQNTLVRFSSTKAVVPEFALALFRSYFRTGTFQAICKWTTSIAHLGAERFAQLPFPLPPLAEQKRIADKLDTLLAHVDAARVRLERVPTLLKQFRQAVLEAAVSGRLTAEWRAARVVNQPWASVRAEDVCAKVQSGGTPKEGWATQPGIPFLKVYNLVDQSINFETRPQFVERHVHETSLSKSRALPGDVLMNIVGPPLGKVAVVPDTYPEWNLNQALVLFRPSEHITTGWLYVLLRHGRNIEAIVHETKGSAGQVNISLSQCRAFQFPLPSLPEQNEIVRRVDELFSWAEACEARWRGAWAAWERLTPALLAKAFRGELVPQDPADEPAAVLLARLREARAAAPSKPGKTGRRRRA